MHTEIEKMIEDFKNLKRDTHGVVEPIRVGDERIAGIVNHGYNLALEDVKYLVEYSHYRLLAKVREEVGKLKEKIVSPNLLPDVDAKYPSNPTDFGAKEWETDYTSTDLYSKALDDVMVLLTLLEDKTI